MRMPVMVVDKDVEDMTLQELRREKFAHNWHSKKLKGGIAQCNKRLWWLEENIPLIDLDEAKRQWENGEITKLEYMTKCGQKARRQNEYQRTEDRLLYAQMLKAEEDALVKALEERIEGEKLKPTPRKRGRKSVDMTKPAGRGNPKASWRVEHPYTRPPRKLRKHSEKWDTIRKQNLLANRIMRNFRSVAQWDLNKLRLIARDRGYSSDMSMIAAVRDELNLTIEGTTKLLKSGALSWGQILVVGAFFEMTPIEFCDTFLSGYFREVVDGKWVAVIDNKNELVTIPVFPRAGEEEVTSEPDSE